jgi:hypothetical protein
MKKLYDDQAKEFFNNLYSRSLKDGSLIFAANYLKEALIAIDELTQPKSPCEKPCRRCNTNKD